MDQKRQQLRYMKLLFLPWNLLWIETFVSPVAITMAFIQPLPHAARILHRNLDEAIMQWTSRSNDSSNNDKFSSKRISKDNKAQKKLSMAEKRKRRAKRPILVQERSNIEFPTGPSQETNNDSDENNTDHRKQSSFLQITTEETVTVTTKSQAQQLLDSQRDSVAFLTKMRECLEQIFQSNVNSNNNKPSTPWFWICRRLSQS